MRRMDGAKRKLDCQTHSACIGEAGLISIITEWPDVVILDVMLPGVDGIEVLRLIRSHPATALLSIS